VLQHTQDQAISVPKNFQSLALSGCDDVRDTRVLNTLVLHAVLDHLLAFEITERIYTILVIALGQLR